MLDENRSPLLRPTLDALKIASTNGLSEEDFVESNKMHAINGYVYCNLPGLSATLNQRYVSEIYIVVRSISGFLIGQVSTVPEG